MPRNRKKPEPNIIALERPKGELKAIGGAAFDQWNEWIVNLLPQALPTRHSSSEEIAGLTATGAIAGMAEMKPSDPADAVVIMQIIAANATALDLYRRAWLPEQGFEVRCRYLALADKAARTVGLLTETLDRRRRGGLQQVTVRHVTVHADQAVVADTVMTGGAGGARDEKGGQPHALGHASLTPMFGEIEADPAAVPRAGGAGM